MRGFSIIFRINENDNKQMKF